MLSAAQICAHVDLMRCTSGESGCSKTSEAELVAGDEKLTCMHPPWVGALERLIHLFLHRCMGSGVLHPPSGDHPSVGIWGLLDFADAPNRLQAENRGGGMRAGGTELYWRTSLGL